MPTYSNAGLKGRTFLLYLNGIGFLEPGTQWQDVAGGGFQIGEVATNGVVTNDITIDGSGNVVVSRGALSASAGYAENSLQTSVPAAGANVTIPNNCSLDILQPAGTLATLTVTMPAAPVVHQVVRVLSTQTITTLTVAANTGQTIVGMPTTLAQNGAFAYIYHGTQWFRMQ